MLKKIINKVDRNFVKLMKFAAFVFVVEVLVPFTVVSITMIFKH